jgi:hypothetical protein
MIARSLAPLRAACVASPLRKLCAPKRVALPAVLHPRFTTKVPTCGVMAPAAMRPWQSVAGKTGSATMPEASS